MLQLPGLPAGDGTSAGRWYGIGNAYDVGRPTRAEGTLDSRALDAGSGLDEAVTRTIDRRVYDQLGQFQPVTVRERRSGVDLSGRARTTDGLCPAACSEWAQ